MVENVEELKKIVLKKILSRGAFERLSRVKLVKPELANQVELYLVQLYQSGKINREITEEEMKILLEKIGSGKKFRLLR